MIICAAAVKILVIVANPCGNVVSTEARVLYGGGTRAELHTASSPSASIIKTEYAGHVPSREAIRAAAVAEMKALRERAVAKGMTLLSVEAITALVRAEREDET